MARTLSLDRLPNGNYNTGMAKAKPTGAETLAAKLADLGWTQEKAELELGFTKGSISRWLSGKRKPGVTSASKIEVRLGIPIAVWTVPQKRKAKKSRVKVSK